jgi:hypothetical protein
MIGRNPLYLAKQHGHSISRMLWIYAAWAEDTTEADVVAIRAAMGATELRRGEATTAPSTGQSPSSPAKEDPHRLSHLRNSWAVTKNEAAHVMAIDLPIAQSRLAVSA